MTDSEQMLTIVALVAAAVVIAVAAFILIRRGTKVRRAELMRHFGPEYERAVDELGRERAEKLLAKRQDRVAHFHLTPLTPADKTRFAESWSRIQAEFVDNPVAAVKRANGLINEVMRARGYPVEKFEQRVADLSAAHPNVVQHYRAAHELSLSVHNEATDTENMRQAMVHYRALFAELLQGEPLQGIAWHRAHAS